MAQTQKRQRRRKRPPQYKYYPFSTSVTVYSADGSPVPETVLNQIEVAIGLIAIDNSLLTAVNRA